MWFMSQTDDDVSSLSFSATAVTDMGLQNRYFPEFTCARLYNVLSVCFVRNMYIYCILFSIRRTNILVLVVLHDYVLICTCDACLTKKLVVSWLL